MHTTARKSAITLLLLATTALGSAAVMATTSTPAPATAAAREHAASNPGQQKGHQVDSLAQKGRDAMSYIVAAYQLLSGQHGGEAAQYLEKAKGLLTKLKSELGTANDKSSDLLPIYSQLGIKEGVEISDQLRQQLNKTHLDAIHGKHREVVEALKSAGIEIQYNFVDLPVTATLEKVESALKSLSEKDSHQASQALADIQQSLVHDSITVNAVSDNPAG